jgi:hypoxanthine phosphoribosyltransferase
MSDHFQEQPKLGPYHHPHTHVEEVSWSKLGEMLIELAEKINQNYRPEIIVGIAKGGVIPAIYLSSAYLLDFFPIKLSSRHNEQIVSDIPIWHVYPTDHVRGKKVLLVDDICVAGRTLHMASEELARRGVSEIRTATLAIHSGSVRPDYFVLETDALIVWPWDRDTLAENGTWSINREYKEEMDEVPGYKPGPSPARK